MESFMRVAAEDEIRALSFPYFHGALRYILGNSEPAFARALDITAQSLFFCVQFLDDFIENGGYIAQEAVMNKKIVELVAVNSEESAAIFLPKKALFNF